MGKNSKIEWTHHTFNPWWGCEKVSPACANCYAEAWARRVGANVWGAETSRRFFGPQHWKQPLAWNAEACRLGTRRRVFCASMADVFEPRPDLDDPRRKLWDLIAITPHLDWLLLTKRPEHVQELAPWGRNWPTNVWLGTTVENQRMAKRRIPHLLKVDAKLRFLSCEPLLGPLGLQSFLADRQVHWVIAGGESGGKARPMDPKWLRALRDDCIKFGTRFHFKQWGNWAPAESVAGVPRVGDVMVRLPKHKAGRILDDRCWDEVPDTVVPPKCGGSYASSA